MDESATPATWWEKKEYASANYGAAELKDLFGEKPFDFPKAKRLVEDCIRASGGGIKGIYIIDFFAGSGTTGHAIIDINRKETIDQKYVLIEMGSYFNSVLKPRILKAVYSENWKDGKPIEYNSGVSQCIKYLQLESYEDSLNNLQFKEDYSYNEGISTNPSLKEDYVLRYMLDIETNLFSRNFVTMSQE